ncbi:MAG: hypothetical protein GX175_08680 [Halanaerobiaceae bacterium]|nr:hypothetical protein [Halanaerobiaceae bacterium]
MSEKKNQGLEQIDFKLILAFTNAYERLYEKGEITEGQFERVLELIEKYQDYTREEFIIKLKEIFS